MHLSTVQVAKVEHKTGLFFQVREGARLRARQVNYQRGFTLVELITIIVILGIISVAAIPRFFDRNVFDSRGFYDQVIFTLRFAQKTAIAQRRFVCVAFGANSVTLTIDSSVPRDDVCDANLTSPAGVTPYTVTAPAEVVFNTVLPAVAPVNFAFTALGSPEPNAGQVITVTGYPTPITLEAGTGYVH